MSRIDLHKQLCSALESTNVYFQPPENIKMKYPAIVYELDTIVKKQANNGVYLSHKRYKVTLIDRNPDSVYIDRLNKLPMCHFIRPYKSDGLNHYVFNIYD